MFSSEKYGSSYHCFVARDVAMECAMLRNNEQLYPEMHCVKTVICIHSRIPTPTGFDIPIPSPSQPTQFEHIPRLKRIDTLHQTFHQLIHPPYRPNSMGLSTLRNNATFDITFENPRHLSPPLIRLVPINSGKRNLRHGIAVPKTRANLCHGYWQRRQWDGWERRVSKV